MPDPTAPDWKTFRVPLLSESDLGVLVALWNAEKGYVGVELSGSWSAVAGSARALAWVALGISVLSGEPGLALRVHELEQIVDVLEFYLAEARQGRRYYDVDRPDPIMAVTYDRRAVALSRAVQAIRLLGAPRRELDDASDRQTERAGGEP